MSDKLGDYMKSLEGIESSRKASTGAPLIARLDGRAFHTFTKGLDRPFDKGMTELMQETTKFLVTETKAMIGYTQSDEITLIWYEPDQEKSYMFGGRFQKIASTLSALASAYFNRNLEHYLPSKKDEIPTFDARVWSVPTLEDAYKTLLWRELDAIKNSITMLALKHFKHKEIHGVDSKKKLQMLREIGDPWENYPSCNRKGTYIKRISEFQAFTAEEIEKIPEKHRPALGEVYLRSKVKIVELPDMQTLEHSATKYAIIFADLFTNR